MVSKRRQISRVRRRSSDDGIVSITRRVVRATAVELPQAARVCVGRESGLGCEVGTVQRGRGQPGLVNLAVEAATPTTPANEKIASSSGRIVTHGEGAIENPVQIDSHLTA